MTHIMLSTAVMGVAVLFALLTVAQMTNLLLRRRRMELGAPLLRARETLLTRELMSIAAGSLRIEDAGAFRGASQAELLTALTHLLQLVRGLDRTRLLAVSEFAGVLDQPVVQLSHARPARRVDAMRLLEQFAVPRSIAALEIALTTDPVHAVRLEAAATLARMGSVPAPSLLIDALDMRTRGTTRLHAALFRRAAPGHALELARLAADDELRSVRPLIVESMGASADLSHADLLGPYAYDADPEVRCAMLRAARRLGNPAASSWAIQLLLDPEDSVRVQAIQTCSALGARDAIPILASLIRNSSWWVRTRAQQALDDMRPRLPQRPRRIGLVQ